MKRIAVLVDISEQGWESCMTSALERLREAGHEPFVQPVHLGSGRSWRQLKSHHDGCIRCSGFLTAGVRTETAREFIAWHSDALLVLPLRETKALEQLVAVADSDMKISRKGILNAQTDVQLGVGQGEPALDQSGFLEEALKLLQTMFWR